MRTISSPFGEPALERRVWRENAVTIDPEVNFTLAAGNALPTNQSIVWSGTLNAPESGKYRIYLQLLGCHGELKIDDRVVDPDLDSSLDSRRSDAGRPGQHLPGNRNGLDNIRAAMELSAGPHRITIEVDPDSSNSPIQVRASWVTPQQQKDNYRAAIEAARQAKTAVVFAWSRTRPVFALPGDQDQLIRDVAAAKSQHHRRPQC